MTSDGEDDGDAKSENTPIVTVSKTMSDEDHAAARLKHSEIVVATWLEKEENKRVPLKPLNKQQQEEVMNAPHWGPDESLKIIYCDLGFPCKRCPKPRSDQDKHSEKKEPTRRSQRLQAKHVKTEAPLPIARKKTRRGPALPVKKENDPTATEQSPSLREPFPSSHKPPRARLHCCSGNGAATPAVPALFVDVAHAGLSTYDVDTLGCSCSFSLVSSFAARATLGCGGEGCTCEGFLSRSCRA